MIKACLIFSLRSAMLCNITMAEMSWPSLIAESIAELLCAFGQRFESGNLSTVVECSAKGLLNTNPTPCAGRYATLQPHYYYYIIL